MAPTPTTAFRLDEDVLRALDRFKRADGHRSRTDAVRALIFRASPRPVEFELHGVVVDREAGTMRWTFSPLPWNAVEDHLILITNSWGNVVFEESYRWDDRAATRHPIDEDASYWVCRRMVVEHVSRWQANRALDEYEEAAEE